MSEVIWVGKEGLRGKSFSKAYDARPRNHAAHSFMSSQ